MAAAWSVYLTFGLKVITNGLLELHMWNWYRGTAAAALDDDNSVQ
jgi:hypothetical protein